MPSGFSPPLFSPYNASSLGYPWGIPSPTAHSPEQMQFNWSFTSPFSPPPPPSHHHPQPSHHYQPQPQAASQPNAPQFRPLSWRTTLCRHYSKNQGWCPLGDECGYIHDLALAAHATEDIRFPNQTRGPNDSRGKSNAKGRAGSKHSHCWAYVQGLCRVKDCPYLHPAAINLFVPHTPCLAWPNCTRGSLCAYKHPEPLASKASEQPTPRPAPPVQPQVAQPPSPVLIYPPGTVQFHGTTYYMSPPPPHPYSPPYGHHVVQPPPPPPPPPPAPPQSSPHYTWYSPIAPSVPSGYSPYSPASIPFRSPPYEQGQSLPPVSIAGSMAGSLSGPSYDENPLFHGMRPPVSLNDATGAADTGVDEDQCKPRSELIEEFPYQPPPLTQRREGHGHARRISVTLRSRDDSDALGLTTTQGSVRPGRESWMGHSQRDGPTHRSWPWVSDAFGIPSQTSQNTSVA
ncbi:hypothetical protein BXZ70DRAFT_360387 [Cristinia sonorae]|uniref:C3H1-type domain-containing protein n=1 Tax=Cristinia sonorae TaxID=1940300 RepID=A0A8K0XMP4_9AGAR|nr:hypothetical protein BXZ70DRAFT_360387 [Cristinia sonorae]